MTQDFKPARLGVRKQFPSIKSYLKNYVLGITHWETEELQQLQRYAQSGPFLIHYGPDLPDGLCSADSTALDVGDSSRQILRGNFRSG